MFYVDVMEGAVLGARVFWSKNSYGQVTGHPIMRDETDELWIPVRTQQGVDMIVEADAIWHIITKRDN